MTIDTKRRRRIGEAVGISLLRDMLTLIATTDSVDAALDPQRAIRVSRTALQGESHG